MQLRQDDAEGRLYNIVGFQTREVGEQRRVFRTILASKTPTSPAWASCTATRTFPPITC